MRPITYQSAGVSIAANDDLVRRLERCIKKTQDRHVITNVGGFAGFYRLLGAGRTFKDPILVSCCDGVGSKVLLAAKAKKLNTVGIDLVAMNVNDLITCGARPLFFLDYVALHKNIPKRTIDLVEGIAKGCLQAGCTLLGGETAEMPDVYRKGDFDLAGFAVGVVDRKRLITGQNIKPGDAIIGLASSGIHSNGYSLARKLFFSAGRYKLSSKIKGLRGALGHELLKPTRIYVKPILSLLDKHPRLIRGMAHITGGGLPGNIPRILPKGCQAVIDPSRWKISPIFGIMQSMGVTKDEMFRVFNMGIGMVLAVRKKDALTTLNHFKKAKIFARMIGTIKKGQKTVVIST